MVTQIIESLIDDLDGVSTADETVQFGLDGKRYEIDLTDENAARLRGALAEFVAAARKAGRPDKPGKPDHDRPKRRVPEEPSAVRQWVRDNGGEIGDRGRIPKDLAEAYERGDTSVIKARQEDARPELAGVGAGGDPFATFADQQGPHF